MRPRRPPRMLELCVEKAARRSRREFHRTTEPCQRQSVKWRGHAMGVGMPELPEVEYASRVLRAAVVGRTIGKVTVLHRITAAAVTSARCRAAGGTTISTVERRGKHQLIASVVRGYARRALSHDGRLARRPITDDVPSRIMLGSSSSSTDGVRVSLVDPRALSTVTPALRWRRIAPCARSRRRRPDT